MSIEQLQNVLKWLEKDLEHFAEDDEIIQEQMQKKIVGIAPCILLKEVNLTYLKILYKKEIRKAKVYVFPTIHMQENTICIIFRCSFLRFQRFQDFKIQKNFWTERVSFCENRIVSEAQFYIRLFFRSQDPMGALFSEEMYSFWRSSFLRRLFCMGTFLYRDCFQFK